MGGQNQRELVHLFRAGADLRVTCPECGRTAVFPIKETISYFHSRNWSTAMQLVGKRFRCAGSPMSPGCGKVGMDVAEHFSLKPPVPCHRDVRDRRG